MEQNTSPVFSIIMPTFNSEKTIEMALKSLAKQDIAKEEVEILVIDGGSTDRTLEIARKYGARILHNPDKEPRAAKRMGFQNARGHWIVMQDSDEVWIRSSQLRKRKEFFEANPDVYLYVADTLIPGKNSGLACPYINIVGDPFSFIVHPMSNFRARGMKDHMIRSDRHGNVYHFTESDLSPNGDGGTTTVDIRKVRELFGDSMREQLFAVTYFLNMVCRTNLVGCIPGDNIVHYSYATFRAYLKKLRFRIYYALNHVEKSGYGARARMNKTLSRRKILFVLYAASVILPILDSFRLTFQYREWSLLLHFFYTYYVVFVTLQESVRKRTGKRGENHEYGK